MTGRATLEPDARRRETSATQFVAEREAVGVDPPSSDDALFRFDLESCLLTRTTGHGDPAPVHEVWRAL